MPVFISDPRGGGAGGRIETLIRTPGALYGNLDACKEYMRLNGDSEAFIAEQVAAWRAWHRRGRRE
jgi:hypothetical protein